MSFAISVENITKSFEESRIIDDVSFNLAPGTSSVIVGPAASGKSLLLKCILGLFEIEKGKILLTQRELEDTNPSFVRVRILYKGFIYVVNMHDASHICFYKRKFHDK